MSVGVWLTLLGIVLGVAFYEFLIWPTLNMTLSPRERRPWSLRSLFRRDR